MEIERRVVLNGMVLTSFAGLAMNAAFTSLAQAASAGAAVAGVQRGRPIVALVGAAAEASGFVPGLAAAHGGAPLETVRADLSMGFVRRLRELLRADPPVRIVGLVDDGCAAVIVQIAQAERARLPWLGEHSASGGEPRHQITVKVADPGLAEGGAATALGGAVEEAASSPELWPAALGYALASLGSNGPVRPLPAGVLAGGPLSGAFASFVIEA